MFTLLYIAFPDLDDEDDELSSIFAAYQCNNEDCEDGSVDIAAAEEDNEDAILHAIFSSRHGVYNVSICGEMQ